MYGSILAKIEFSFAWIQSGKDSNLYLKLDCQKYVLFHVLVKNMSCQNYARRKNVPSKKCLSKICPSKICWGTQHLNPANSKFTMNIWSTYLPKRFAQTSLHGAKPSPYGIIRVYIFNTPRVDPQSSGDPQIFWKPS